MAVSDPFTVRSPREARSETSHHYAVLGEFAEICRDPVSGVMIVPSGSVPYRWHGTLGMIGGLYDGGFFQFQLNFSLHNSASPQVIFWPPPFHPLVDPRSGEFDFSLKFPLWQKENRIRDILLYLKEQFTEPSVDGRKNLEAACLLEQSRSDYKAHARLNIKDIFQELCSESSSSPSSELSFGPCMPELLEPQLKQILETGDKICSKRQLPKIW
ncbi:AKT-interacting protein homolog B-like [Paramacrobiotus metropolitanus]|uniref:AKT-interacting protein homolog B-like n=1 Tax=Paramacrobiotus metropolitanus TaxID=2943436 RepID=UPI0024458149|nr:AKT-interacting protein homolog B-like [Paramacrobiotus metropolitanus]